MNVNQIIKKHNLDPKRLLKVMLFEGEYATYKEIQTALYAHGNTMGTLLNLLKAKTGMTSLDELYKDFVQGVSQPEEFVPSIYEVSLCE